MIKPLHGRLSLSPALVLTIALASGCGRVTKVYTTAGDVCDSLDVVFESAQGKLAETEWRAIISGDLSGLKQQRAEWSEYLVKSAYLDSLRQLERMVSDTVLLNRLSLIRRRILSELAANDPSVSMVMDSLSYRRLKSGITAPPPPDSLPEDSLPSAEKRLGMYRTYFESGASLKDWPARLTRLRNRQRRSVGYNSALDLNLELVGITRDRVEELVRKVDSVSRGPYRRLLDTLKSQFSIRNLGAEDLLYYREYMTPGRENRGLKVSRRRTLRACRQALEKLGLPIENRPLYIDTQSVSAKLTAPQLVCAHPPDDVRLLLGSMRGSSPVDYLRRMGHELGRAVYLTEIKAAPYSQRRPVDPLWERTLGHIFEEIVTSAEYVINAVYTDRREWKKFEPWLKNRRLILLRERLALIRFEFEMYENPNRDLNALFWEIYQDALMVRPQRDLSPWAVHFELLSDPASQFCELLAAMISAQTRSHARREFDAVVDNPDFGTFLKRAYYAPGSWSSWSDLLLEGVGEQFEPRYYLNSIRSLHRPSPN